MKKSLALAGLIVVLLFTGGAFLRFGGEQPVQAGVRPLTQPPAVPAPAAALIQESDEELVENGEAPVAAAWPDWLVVVPADGSQACPTTAITANFMISSMMRLGGALDPATIWLSLNDEDVTPQSRIAGGGGFPETVGTITYQPPSLLRAGDHQATIWLVDDDGFTQGYTWTFNVSGAACQAAPSPTSAPAQPTAAPPAPGTTPVAPPPPAPTGTQTGPAVGTLPSQGFLHIVADHAWLSPAGETQRTARTDVWLNLTSGDSRLTEKDPATGADVTTTIRSGQSITVLIHQEKRASTQIFPDANVPQLNEVRDTLLGYRQAYEQGRLQFVVEETVDGMPAIHVQAPPQGESGGIEVWLRKDNGLVLREIAYRMGSGGAREIAQTHVVTYRQVETPGNASPDLFTASVPTDWAHTTSRLLTPQAAAAARDPELYWLGPEWQGNVLVNLSQETVSGPPPPGAPPGAPTGPQTFYVAAYVTAPPSGQAPPQPQPGAASMGITLLERPAPPQSAQQQPGRSQPGQSQPGGPPGGESVTINGNRGTIFTPPPPPTPPPAQGQPSGPPPAPPVILDLTIGNTNVVIQGRDRAQVMQVAQDLKRVTP